MKKKKIFFIIMLLAVIKIACAGGTSVQAAEDKNHYTITTDETYPPFVFQNKDKQYEGIDMDLLKSISKIENFTYTIKPMSFNMAAQAVANRQADGIIAGMTITPEREKIYDASNSYYKTGVVFAVGQNSKITSLSDLKGKTIAAKTGTASAKYALEMSKKYDFKITYFSDSNILYNDVIAGNSVACFEDEPVIKYAIKNGVNLKIPDQTPAQAGYYAFFVQKGQNQELLKKFNSGLKKLKANGQYQEIVNKYLSTETPKKNNKNKPHYTIVCDVTFPPFEIQAKNGKYVGIDIDLLNQISIDQGFTYTLKPMSFNSATQSVTNGQADGIISGLSVTDERKKVFDFSDPYFVSGFIWATREDSSIKSLNDLKGKTVALKTGTGSADYGKSIQSKYGFKIKYFNDSNTMYNDVVVGNAVACFEDQPVMQYAIKNGIKLTIPKQTPANQGNYAFAVQKGKNSELLKSFNTGLKQLQTNGTFDQIKAKYLGGDQKKITGNTKEDTSFWGIISSNKSMFISGLTNTLTLTVCAILIASIWGVILGVMGVSEHAFVRGIYSTVIYIFRGLPLLVLAFFVYIGLPNVTGIKISTFAAGLFTLVLNEGAYTAAFVKGGFDAVDPGQMEAARALGVPYSKAMRGIVMPQGLRIMIPSFINQFIITLKDTSIISAIGFVELTQTGQLLVARTQQGFIVYGIVALIYLIVITLLTWLSKIIEKRLS
ncbi:ABC transporter substrate-binding protein/permease [Xylocopilactobacillus apicola]|uniref:Amino acid ABC transporter permease n=1 Tax=Xylocopilactobacillus apicola TaxID=2932184 RepID=A0AAU9DR33_9LACO|nr:ABC transporter substrate-binding protein/permease [Xylocopilactobacillus apicola]BDR59667.1 amino acid ABC transporter permease [Xylocopilactobacillus apicola]